MGGDIAAWCGAARHDGHAAGSQRRTASSRPSSAPGSCSRSGCKDPQRGRQAACPAAADVAGDGVAQADVVIEAIVEKSRPSGAVCRSSNRGSSPTPCSRPTPRASRSRSWPRELRDPGRLVGMHFFNPVAQMQLVEIVQGAGSDPAALDAGRGLRSRAARQAAAAVPERAGVRRQPHSDALYQRGDVRPGRKACRPPSIDRAAQAFRHADGSDRAGRRGRPRCRPARRHACWPTALQRRVPADARETGGAKASSAARAARAFTAGGTASRSSPSRRPAPSRPDLERPADPAAWSTKRRLPARGRRGGRGSAGCRGDIWRPGSRHFAAARCTMPGSAASPPCVARWRNSRSATASVSAGPGWQQLPVRRIVRRCDPIHGRCRRSHVVAFAAKITALNPRRRRIARWMNDRSISRYSRLSRRWMA